MELLFAADAVIVEQVLVPVDRAGQGENETEAADGGGEDDAETPSL